MLRLAAPILLCLGCNLAQAAGNTWATTEFTVVYATPVGSTLDKVLDPIIETLEPVTRTSAQNAVAREIEAMLHLYAEEYQRLGFRDPKLRTHLGRYVVNVHPYGGQARARACVLGSNFPSTLEIDSAVADGSNQDHHALLPEHLAHELFHAIQYKYNMCQDHKDPGDFFTEGAAQAVGHDMRYHLTGQERSRGSTQRWGTRSYRRAPHKPESRGEAYETAAFWRYIAEYAAHNPHGGRAGIHEYKKIRPDYRYLHRLMEDWKGVSDSGTTVLTWLDAGLKRETGLGLAAMYAQFLSVYLGFGAEDADDGQGKARYVDARMTGYVREKTLGQCQPLVVSGLGPHAGTTVTLAPMTARCVELDVRIGAGKTNIVVNARGMDAEQIDQFWIGTPGNLAIGHPIMPAAPAPVGGGHIGLWNFNVPANGKQVFILLNAMDSPHRTRPLELELSFVVPTFEHSMIPEAAQPSAPARAPRPAPRNGTGESRDVVRERADASLQDALEGQNYTRMVELGHSPDANDCGDEPVFLYRACGPVTKIDLGLQPDVLPFISTHAPGALHSQIISSARAFLETEGGLPVVTLSMLEQANRLADQDGPGVSLVIPKIDYGFTGTLPAQISMRGKGHSLYEAVSPQSDKHARRQLTGQVDIDEYTPLVLRGRFHGLLLDTGNPVPGTHPPVLPVKGNISGRFSTASRLHEAPPADKANLERYVMDNLMQDLFLSTPGIRPEVRDTLQTLFNQELEKQLPEQKRAPGNARGGVSPISPFPSCDCRCGQPVASGCESSCRVTATVCPALALRPSAETIEQSTKWRKALVERLDARNTSTQVRTLYLSEFDNAPDDDARRLLLRSLDIPVGQ